MPKCKYVGPFAEVWVEAIGQVVKRDEEVELPEWAITAAWERVTAKKSKE